MPRIPCVLPLFLFAACCCAHAHAAERVPNNVVVFVADGLRGAIVDADTAPVMDALRREGVAFPNSHSLFPTVTTANASAIATGHYLGDTGDYANSLYMGFAAQSGNGEASVTPFLEDDVLLGELDRHFQGDYLDEDTLLALARRRGYSTAAVGKTGPTVMMDHTESSATATLLLDDRSGLTQAPHVAPGPAMNDWLAQALGAAGLALTPPAADAPNLAQQRYQTDVVERVLLPEFRRRQKPFVLVFWARDPDLSQHNQLDSRYAMLPGINGSTSLDAIRNSDATLGRLRRALAAQGLAANTDIFVTSDHGFSTISRQSESSPAAHCTYADTPAGFLPPGFLAFDLAQAMDLPLRDPDDHDTLIDTSPGCGTGHGDTSRAALAAHHTRRGNGLLGHDAARADIVVTANGGADLIYLTTAAGRALAPAIVQQLLAQDYVGGIFLNDALGAQPGTIPLSAINLLGHARTPQPDIVISMRSFSTGCPNPLRCSAEVADGGLQQGQGNHGSFSGGDTLNFMAAVGPDFKTGFSDPAPVGNVDILPTLAGVLGLTLHPNGSLVGRVLSESLRHGSSVAFSQATCLYPAANIGTASSPDQPPLHLLQPALQVQSVGATRYFDAAGFEGRTLGLSLVGAKVCQSDAAVLTQ